MGHGNAQSFPFGLGVLKIELGTIDLLAREKGSVPRVFDLDLLEHLTDDHLNVLVIDANPLQPVNLLDLVD